MPAKTVIQLRKDTAANWTSVNPILAIGEPGIETDTNKVKFGDGSTTWNSLSYFGSLDFLDNIGDVVITSATAGEVLQFDGTNWINSVASGESLPDQTGNSGKYLTTDGADASWGTIDLSSKQDIITGAATTITSADLTASRALVSNASGKVEVSTVTATQLGYLSGVTSAIQTQLNAKVGTSNGSMLTASSSSTVVRNITLSTGDPSGGSDGQVWLKYS